MDLLGRPYTISIHAPPRGATVAVHATIFFKAFQFTPLREGRPCLSHHLRPRHDFNSRPSARGDSDGVFTPLSYREFQFTPLREGRLTESTINCATENFNSRPSARGDYRLMRYRIRFKSFQFTPLREGRRFRRNSLRGCVRPFQFTPLREGRHPLHECNTEGIFISIHAPPRGATGSPDRRAERDSISIHAPPRGATIRFKSTIFPSRISIHAPPRGATCGVVRRLHSTLFQFTPLREGRQSYVSSKNSFVSDFNSRPSARGDTFAG